MLVKFWRSFLRNEPIKIGVPNLEHLQSAWGIPSNWNHQGGKEKNNNPMKQTWWNAITCAVYTYVYCVYCILLVVLLRATKVTETLVPSTVRLTFIHPGAGGSSDQICITNCAAKCDKTMGLEGPKHETDVTDGFFARPKRIMESWSELTTVSELSFFRKVYYYSRRDPCGYCTWLFLSYRFQNMYASHFTHLAQFGMCIVFGVFLLVLWFDTGMI